MDANRHFPIFVTASWWRSFSRSMNEMQGVLRFSTTEGQWSGLQARVFDTSGGMMEVVPQARHHVSMHLGSPVRAYCRCDGRWQRRLQSAGDIDIVPMGCPVRWEDEGPASVIALSLSPSLIHRAAVGLETNPDTVVLSPHLQMRDPLLQHICWAIVAQLQEGDPGNSLYGDSLGLALASHLLRRYAKTDRKRQPKLSRRQLGIVLDYIRENIGERLSLDELAGVAGLSPSHFKTLFKETLNAPVHQYVVMQRVERAAQLLLQGAPATEVAAQTGFSDQSHMARCMRRTLGITPRSLRG